MTQLATPARIIPLHAMPRAWQPRRADSDDSFWPELSSAHALDEAAPVNPDNRPARVLSEIALILGAVGAVALAVLFFLPVSP